MERHIINRLAQILPIRGKETGPTMRIHTLVALVLSMIAPPSYAVEAVRTHHDAKMDVGTLIVSEPHPQMSFFGPFYEQGATGRTSIDVRATRDQLSAMAHMLWVRSSYLDIIIRQKNARPTSEAFNSASKDLDQFEMRPALFTSLVDQISGGQLNADKFHPNDYPDAKKRYGQNYIDGWWCAVTEETVLLGTYPAFSCSTIASFSRCNKANPIDCARRDYLAPETVIVQPNRLTELVYNEFWTRAILTYGDRAIVKGFLSCSDFTYETCTLYASEITAVPLAE